MDEQLEERLARIEKTVNDTNKMVAAMRHAQKKAAYWRAFYWIIIIGMTIISIYYITPLISQFGASYGIGTGSTNTDSSSTGSTSSTAELLNLVKQYQAQKARQ